MKDPYEHIHKATDKRLAEMLEQTTINGDDLTSGEMTELHKEAARRLRTRQHIDFNSEAFSL